MASTINDLLPIELLDLKFWGNFYLMWIMVWIKTGFAMVIFSAALRGVPQ